MKINSYKLKFNLILMLCIFFIVLGYILLTYSRIQYNVYEVMNRKSRLANQSVNIDNNSLLEKSTLDNLTFNFSKLPTLTVKTDYKYEIEGEDGVNRGRPQIDNDTVQQPIRSVTFLDLPYNQKVDIEVEAFFENCGTLDGENLDIKIVYTDFYSTQEYAGEDLEQEKLNNSKVLWWTSYGVQENQNIDNEWCQRGFENINMKIYFYINGTEKLLETAYFSLYDLNGENGISTEAVNSDNSSKVYLYKNTNIKYIENISHGEEQYFDLYAGVNSGENLKEKESAISFLYKNVEYIDINLHSLNMTSFNGYHLNFLPLTTNYEGEAIKEVSVCEATVGEEISYTISYQMPNSQENLLQLSNLKFTDELNKNLVYQSLKVYDENENDITEIAGKIDVKDNTVIYLFNSEYLNSINYVGQNYKFIIKVKITDNPTENLISNSATITENDNDITTNCANLDLISYVIVRHLDEYGNELEEPVKLKGKLFEEYNTEAAGYLYYEIMELPENTTGIFKPEIQEVNYTYIKTVTDYEVYKVWVDDTPTMEISDIEGVEQVKRPDSIKLKLSSNKAEEVKIVEMKDDNQFTPNPYGTMTLDTEEITDDGVWYYKFENLPRFDENGEEIVYSVTEYDVPEGYYMSNCLNDSEYGIATIANTRQTVLIINKYDYFTNEPLEGAVFSVDQIYGDSVLPVGDYTTNSAGMAVVSYINNGTYRIREIKAPEGYKLSDETYEVEMVSSTPEIILDVPNKPIINLPQAGGNGTKTIISIGILTIISSLIVCVIINNKKDYKFKHRY